MRNQRSFLLAIGVVLLLCLGAAMAQTQSVQITKGPTVEHTGSTDAVIAWSTNVSASTVVKYGTDSKNLSQTAQAPWGGLTHRVDIKNLEPGKTYYYQVDSGQGQGTGTSALSNVEKFTTQAQGTSSNGKPGNPSDKLHITNGPVVEHVADTNATIAWTTDLPSSSIVKYGTDRNTMSQTAEQPWGATTHRVQLKNLKPSTQYFFTVHSAQGKNAPGESEDTQPQPFTTAARGQTAMK
jgi:phosphodiesterase/alkaline phosphatase D-like protein